MEYRTSTKNIGSGKVYTKGPTCRLANESEDESRPDESEEEDHVCMSEPYKFGQKEPYKTRVQNNESRSRRNKKYEKMEQSWLNERNELSTIQSRNVKRNRKSFFLILTLLIGLAGYFYKDKFFPKESAYNKNTEFFLVKFSDFKTDFSNQPDFTYDVINSTVLNVLESRHEHESPGVILLLGTEGNVENLRRIKFRLSEILLNTFSEPFYEYSFDCRKKANFYSNSVEEIKESIDSGIKSILGRKKFIVIDNLDYLHTEAVPMLQHFFDRKNAPFKDVIYLLTALTKERFIGQSVKDARNMATEYFDRVWAKCDTELRNAMYDSIFNSIAVIVPDIEKNDYRI